jgi:hypothetical protein
MEREVHIEAFRDSERVYESVFHAGIRGLGELVRTWKANGCTVYVDGVKQ